MNDAAQARDEHLMSAIGVAVTAGFTIRRGEVSLRYADGHPGAYYVESVVIYEVFHDLRSAVAYYLDLCDPA